MAFKHDRDGDAVDCFIGPHPDSEVVFVIDQEHPSGRFDEHKVMIGWTSQQDAKRAYLASYSPGHHCGPITAMTVEQFKQWLQAGDTKRRVAEQVSRYTETGEPERYATTKEKLFVRFGDPAGASRTKLGSRTEDQQDTFDRKSEPGLSVYGADDVGGQMHLHPVNKREAIYHIGDEYWPHMMGGFASQQRPIYLVKGKRSTITADHPEREGEQITLPLFGSDGEPVLDPDSVEIVRELEPSEVIANGTQVSHWYDRYPQAGCPDRYAAREWTAVDLDGTLAYFDGHFSKWEIGQPIWRMVERVKEWLAQGKDVRILTARVYGPDAEQQRRLIQDWCRRYIGRVLPITNQKDPAMAELWDDRAIQVSRNTGEPVGRFTQENEPESTLDQDLSTVADRYNLSASEKRELLDRYCDELAGPRPRNLDDELAQVARELDLSPSEAAAVKRQYEARLAGDVERYGDTAPTPHESLKANFFRVSNGHQLPKHWAYGDPYGVDTDYEYQDDGETAIGTDHLDDFREDGFQGWDNLPSAIEATVSHYDGDYGPDDYSHLLMVHAGKRKSGPEWWDVAREPKAVWSVPLRDLHDWIGSNKSLLDEDGKLQAGAVREWVEANEPAVRNWMASRSTQHPVEEIETLPLPQDKLHLLPEDHPEYRPLSDGNRPQDPSDPAGQ